MNEEIKPDEEDTISVPLPESEPEPEPEEKAAVEPGDALEQIAFDMADVVSAMEAIGRTVAMLSTQFERLRVVIEGEEGAVTHAPPVDAKGPVPCCGRSVLDIPMNERISFDGAGITCKGASG